MRNFLGPRRVLAALIAGAALSACSVGSDSMGETLGLTLPPPDPFLVVARAPIEVPADLRALPRPQPGAPSRVDPNPVADARAALLGSRSAAAPAPVSPGEEALLRATGAADADPAIRETITASAPVPERKFGLTSFFGVPIIQDPVLAAERLSPSDEAERLRTEGLPAPVAPPDPAARTQTVADTPSIAPVNPKRR